MAIASLVLGIVSLALCWTGWIGIITGLVALVLGIIGLIKLKKADDQSKKGKFIAGTVTGAIGLIISIIIIVVALMAANALAGAIKDSFESGINSSNLKSSYSVGEKAEIDGFELLVTNVSDYTNTDEYYQPEEGDKYIKVDISATNNGSTDQYVSTYGFNCYADNISVSEAYLYDVDDFPGATLSTGKTTSGSIYYEVPENASSILLEYDYNIYQDQKIIFNLK